MPSVSGAKPCSTPSRIALHAKAAWANAMSGHSRTSPPDANAHNAGATAPISEPMATPAAGPGLRREPRRGLKTDPRGGPKGGPSDGLNYGLRESAPSVQRVARMMDAGWEIGRSSGAERAQNACTALPTRTQERRNEPAVRRASGSSVTNAARSKGSIVAGLSEIKNEVHSASIEMTTNDHIAPRNAVSGVNDSTMCNKPLCWVPPEPMSRQQP